MKNRTKPSVEIGKLDNPNTHQRPVTSIKRGGFIGPIPALQVKICGHESAFHV